MTLLSRLKSLRFSDKSIPWALLIACILSYGLLIPWLGFYWDDWPYILLYRTHGPLAYIPFLASDRPFSPLIHVLISSVIGDWQLGYHLLMLVIRWLAAVAFWWALRAIWPQHARRLVWAPFLFAVYPGFSQQPLAVIYTLHWPNMIISILSLGWMALALRRPARRRWLTLLSLTGPLSLLVMEYFFGLEILRPLLIWFVLAEQNLPPRQRLIKTLRAWLPYALILTVFMVWRVAVFQFPTYSPVVLDKLQASPLLQGWRFIETALRETFVAGVQAWLQPLSALGGLEIHNRLDVLYWALIVLGALAACLYLLRLKTPLSDQPTQPIQGWPVQPLIAALVALFAAGLPFWATDLSVGLYFPNDRFTLPFIFGASLLAGTLLDWLIRLRWQKVLTLGLILGLSFGWHFQSAQSYRTTWLNQQSFLWQLAWRAPGLQPGTLLLTHQLPFSYYSDNSLTAPINLMYAPDLDSYELPYMLYYLRVRIGNELLDADPGLKIDHTTRNFHFSGNTSQSLLFYYNPPGCLRILGPGFEDEIETLPYDYENAAALASTAAILPQANPAAQPPVEYFDPIPANWCYYFEKADLARQLEDWQQVADLGDTARSSGFAPQVESERVAFIDAYARLNRVEDAKSWTIERVDNSAESRRVLCVLWQKIAARPNISADLQAAAAEMQTDLDCKPAP